MQANALHGRKSIVPNLVDIVEMAEALESKAVFVAPERCVAVRNRHSS